MQPFYAKMKEARNSRWVFFALTLVLFWLKTLYAYWDKFSLGISTSNQVILAIFNPIPTAMLLLGLALYMRGRKSYVVMLIIDFLMSLWLFSNILYYREFSDFLTASLIQGSSAVSNNLSKSIIGIIEPSDFLVFADVALLAILLLVRLIKVNPEPIKKSVALSVTGLACVLFGFNLSFAQADRSGLLTRTFDNNYIVKYLGLNAYAVYDSVKAARTSAIRSKANASDMKTVQKYIKANYIPGNSNYTGVAKGKNVIIIHLESFQQFLIDFKWDGKEVTPNLNKIYHESDTLSFDNFFNQVGQGKTSDAETMLENSLYGLPEGSAMVKAGSVNTWQAAPNIFDNLGYTSAAFHGDVPSFWNRDNTYKRWGYDFFFTKSYFPKGKSYDIGYGMKDKLFFDFSAKYINQLPQPFYLKLITLTNHYPYPLDKKNISIKRGDTGDSTVDGYVQTAHYLDQAIGEFMTWLKETGLEKNSVVLFYGDHYGISGNHKPAIAKLLGKKNFNNFDNAQFQRVPLMIHMPGLKGGINHTYGGEIDVLPTLMNLMGISNKGYIQFGSDLLAKNRRQIVAFRNSDFVTPQYTKVGSTYYDTSTGKAIKHPNASVKNQLDYDTNYVATQLSLSDSVINGDLLRFYQPAGFKAKKAAGLNYKYSAAMKFVRKLEKKNKTSLNQTLGKDKVPVYKTDAPELKK